MIREIDINEISDGKRYSKDDMVRMGCNDCDGCHQCCTGMGDSIILDPYDIYELIKGTGKTISSLLEDALELGVVDGIIQPHIRMDINRNQCSFLSDSGRCSIHSFRPGFCRLFPLGRIYEDGSFTYFHQVNECPYPNKYKVKIKPWLGIPNLKLYEQYILDWHFFLKDMQSFNNNCSDENLIKTLNMLILNTFYIDSYNSELDFYPQFYERLATIKQKLSL